MNPRLEQKITVLLFCAFLVIMGVLYLFLPKQDFSQLEKRYLSDAPKLSRETVIEGDLMDDTADYMADHMPFRDFFVGLHAYYELLSGRQVTKDIYVADGDRLVEAPVIWKQVTAERNIAAINGFSELVNVPVDMMVIPSAGWAAQNLVRGMSDAYMDEQIIEGLYALADETVLTHSVTDVYYGREDLFYRTDHHWNSLGAWNGYKQYVQSLGLPYREADAFSVESVDGFYGSTYSRSGLWLVPDEPIALWHGSEHVIVTNAENEIPHDGVFYRERLEEADMYTVNLDGNHSLVRLENPDALTDETLLVVRDSYSNSLGTFLTETFRTVILVDLRYYRQPVSELCAAENADRVLVCYSIGNFMTDTNIVWLK